MDGASRLAVESWAQTFFGLAPGLAAAGFACGACVAGLACAEALIGLFGFMGGLQIERRVIRRAQDLGIT